MDAAVVQVSKPVWNSRHYDSAPVQPLLIFIIQTLIKGMLEVKRLAVELRVWFASTRSTFYLLFWIHSFNLQSRKWVKINGIYSVFQSLFHSIMPVTEDLMVIYLSCPLLLRILYFLHSVILFSVSYNLIFNLLFIAFIILITLLFWAFGIIIIMKGILFTILFSILCSLIYL